MYSTTAVSGNAYKIGDYVIFCGEVFIVAYISAFTPYEYGIYNKRISIYPIEVYKDALQPCPQDRKVLAAIDYENYGFSSVVYDFSYSTSTYSI